MTVFRDAARKVLEARLPAGVHGWGSWIEGTLDELDGCVRPQTIDRDALAAAWDDGNAVGLDGWVGPNRGTEPDGEAIRLRQQYLDRYALVQPDEGVTLTYREAQTVLGWYADVDWDPQPAEYDRALAWKLGSAS